MNNVVCMVETDKGLLILTENIEQSKSSCQDIIEQVI